MTQTMLAAERAVRRANIARLIPALQAQRGDQVARPAGDCMARTI